MFFQKSKRMQKEFSAKLDELSDGLKQLNRGAVTQEKENGRMQDRLSGIEEGVEESKRLLRRQMDSFEDLIESLEEDEKRQDSFSRICRDYQERDERLVKLAMLCAEQLHMIQRTVLESTASDLEANQAWKNQFSLMEQERKSFMMGCGLEEIGAVGEQADHTRYEILKAVDTADQMQADMVAEVYMPGWACRGQILKKAKAAVYRYIDNTQSEEHR